MLLFLFLCSVACCSYIQIALAGSMTDSRWSFPILVLGRLVDELAGGVVVRLGFRRWFCDSVFSADAG